MLETVSLGALPPASQLSAAKPLAASPPPAAPLHRPDGEMNAIRDATSLANLQKALEASLEERSLHCSEAEQRKKSIDDRNFEGVEHLLPAARIERIWLLLNGPRAAKNLEPEVRQLLKSARENGSLPASLCVIHPDFFHRYLILKQLQTRAEDAADLATASLVAAAAEEIARAHGPALQASLNAVEASADVSCGSENRERLRRVYGETVPSEARPLDILAALHRDFGDAGLTAALKDFQRIIARELKTPSRSVPLERLEQLMKGMACAGHVWTSLARAEGLRQQLARLEIRTSSCALAGGLLSLIEGDASTRALNQFAEGLKLPPHLRAPFFGAVERELMGWEPGLWEEPRYRARLMDALRRQGARNLILG